MQQNFVTRLLPGTGQQAVGGKWSNPGNITVEDGNYASFTNLSMGSPSLALQGLNFPVPTLPPGAVVDGIALNVIGQKTGTFVTLDPVSLNISGSSTKEVVFGGLTGGPADKWGKSSISQSDLTNLVTSFNASSIGGVDGTGVFIDAVYLIIYWHIELPNTPADVPTRFDYKMYSNDGVFLGNLPNVSSRFAFSQDINSAGSSIDILCGSFIENEVTTSVLQTEAGADLLTEASQPILAEFNDQKIALGNSDDRVLYKNGNRVKVWMYNHWYPNGKLMFSGQINKMALSYGGDYSVKLTAYSDGIDLDNYLLQPASSFSYTNDVVQNTSNTTTNVTATIMGAGGKDGSPTYWTSLGQTFKAGAIQRIGAIIVYGVGMANLKLTLRANSPTGGIIGTAYAAAPSVAGNIPFYFTTPINVIQGANYFFSVEIDMAGVPKDTTASATIYRTTANAYADGAAYRSTNSAPAWSTSIGGDLRFTTQSASLGNTTVTYTSKDPITEMVAPALADYNTKGGLIEARNLVPAGVALTYAFNSSTIFEVIKKAIELSPVGFYSYVDLGTAEIDIANASETADFVVTRSKNVNKLDLVLTIENISNVLLFSGGEIGGGDNLLRTYSDPNSISQYGSRTRVKSDNRVTIDATANAVGETYIEENADEQQETSITVLNEDMDITLLTPGKTIGFRNFGSLIDGLVLQISRREYNPDSVTLTLGRLPVRMNDVIAGINLALKYQETYNNPSSPS